VGATVSSFGLSPDGRWLALDYLREGVRVWDVAGDRLLEPPPAGIPDKGPAMGRFSPDGRWLVTSGQSDYRVWRVGHWEDPPVIIPRENSGTMAGALAFSRDGRLLAILATPVEVQLIDLETFAELARLLAPDARFISGLRFSPDGRVLAAATDMRVIQLWDLRAIREELRGMGLDWDLPPYPPNVRQPVDPLHLALFPDRIEAENLKLVGSENCKWDMRDTSPRGRGAWSNDRELFGEAEPGGYLEFELQVPQTGRYTLGISFTKAPDFGLVEVSLDGERLSKPVDGFHDSIVRSEKTDFGTMALDEGRHRLRFTAVGKNPKATQHHFAVDCLEFLPVDGSPG
jgi:WD40 repeat protein